MKTRLLCLTTLGLSALAAMASAADGPAPRQTIVRIQRPAVAPAQPFAAIKPQATTASYSVELPQISRVQGATAFFRTSVDITNNTNNNGVRALVQYSYNCLSGACAGTFNRTPTPLQGGLVITLASRDNFHSDDFVQYLDSLSLLQPGAVDGSFGTLLVTFDNLPSATGWEGTVIARNYNRLVETDPSQGTVGYSYGASLFFESAHNTVVGTIRDTTPAALAGGIQGSQRTNLGVRNTDINQTNQPVSVTATFYDTTEGSPTNGAKVGNDYPLGGIQPGQVVQVSNVFTAAAIPSNVSSAIAFIDVQGASSNSPTIEGYFNIVDNVTSDAAFFEMKCADPNALVTCGH